MMEGDRTVAAPPSGKHSTVKLTSSVQDLLRDSLDALSTSERKVARAILAAYPIAGLETVAELAQRANVSSPTVIRFVTKLGFSGYPAFQQMLMHEVQERLGSPLAQYGTTKRPVENSFIDYVSQVFLGNMQESLRELPESELSAAVDMLIDTRRRINLIGGHFSQMLASYLAAHLQLLRSGIAVIPNDEMSRLAAVADASRSDVMVVFDYRRYEPETVRFAQRVADRGSDVLLFTDRWLSPAADVAAVVLPARVESPSPFDSLVPAMALVETVIAAVTERLGDAGKDRVGAIEAMRSRVAKSRT